MRYFRIDESYQSDLSGEIHEHSVLTEDELYEKYPTSAAKSAFTSKELDVQQYTTTFEDGNKIVMIPCSEDFYNGFKWNIPKI